MAFSVFTTEVVFQLPDNPIEIINNCQKMACLPICTSTTGTLANAAEIKSALNGIFGIQ